LAEPTALFHTFSFAIRTPESVMDMHATEIRSAIIGIAGGLAIALVLVLFTVGEGHNGGRPSGGEGNPMQTGLGK
jgi:hypothetical protein